MGHRILIADDDAEALGLFRRLLEDAQTQIVEASSGADLIHALTEGGHFDLIVTDVSMPWMTGIQVLRTARRAGMRTPFLVVTALDTRTLEQWIGEFDGARLMRKPFAIKAFRDTVRAMLNPLAAVG